ncbi:MAG: phosphohistidine phosphatase SixA [Verrucomicrobiota bacterium]
MKLYFLRHATATDIAPTDEARALTPHGEAEAKSAGLALGKLGAKLTHIGCSPLLRARQTAAIVATTLQFAGKVEPLEELVNGAPTLLLLQAIKARTGVKEMLLVGHMPSLAGHLSELVFEIPASRAGFTPAGAACVELAHLKLNAGRLLWFKPHSELAKSA